MAVHDLDSNTHPDVKTQSTATVADGGPTGFHLPGWLLRQIPHLLRQRERLVERLPNNLRRKRAKVSWAGVGCLEPLTLIGAWQTTKST